MRAPTSLELATADPLDRPDYLFKVAQGVAPKHKPGCTFGAGFFRLHYRDGGIHQTRQYTSEDELRIGMHLLSATVAVDRVQRDACLDWDGTPESDANTPDVLDGEQFLAMAKKDGMAALGVSTEAEYARAYNAISDAVYTRDNRQNQGGVRASIVIRKKNAERKVRTVASTH